MCVFAQRCITRAKHRLHWRYLILRRINRHVNSRPSLPTLTIKKLARKELILSRLTTSSLKSFLLTELSTPPSIVLDKVFSTLTFPLVQKLLFQRVIFFPVSYPPKKSATLPFFKENCHLSLLKLIIMHQLPCRVNLKLETAPSFWIIAANYKENSDLLI